MIERFNKELKAIGDSGILPAAAERLMRIMEGERSRLEKRLDRSRRLAEKYRDQVRVKEPEWRTLQENIERVSGAKEINISLLHKGTSGAAYIKGRCWWNGKQREVQIGSIPSVLARINQMIENGDIDYLDTIKDTDVTWEEVRKREGLVQAIREIGRIKFRKYMIKKLLSEYHAADEGFNAEPEPPQNLEIERSPVAEPVYLDAAASGNWYDQWRKENL
ncbi:MAG: hypothetical protein V3W14_00530 [Candidatus Neomarinimicrobiota bacterium]